MWSAAIERLSHEVSYVTGDLDVLAGLHDQHRRGPSARGYDAVPVELLVAFGVEPDTEEAKAGTGVAPDSAECSPTPPVNTIPSIPSMAAPMAPMANVMRYT